MTGDPNEPAFTGHLIASRTTCPDWEANARLIATAPDLLEACRLAMVFFANGTPVHVGSVAHQAIASAVARANGEPFEQWID